MTSADNTRYVTVEMFREGIAEIKTELRELKGEIRVLEREVAVNSAKIEMLQNTFYWGLAIIAIAAALAPIFKREKSEQPTMSEILLKFDERFDEKISRALGVKNQ